MKNTQWTKTDSIKAQQIWKAYQDQHDLSGQHGQTAGIDPLTERIWFGQSIQEIVQKRDAEGVSSPLFFERVGSQTYVNKGGHY